MKTQENKFIFYLNFILKPWGFPLGLYKLNTKFEKLWNNKSREQVLLNLVGQYGVQKYFLIRKFSEIDLCEVIT
jgi:hypothetical protein